MNKMIKADYIFIIMTVCHGLITFLFLGGMPSISIGVFSVLTAIAFLVWAIYDGILYLLLRKGIMGADINVKQIFIAILFGIGSAIIKGIVDSASGQIGYYLDDSFVTSVFSEEIITWFFGMIMLFLLFKRTGYEKNNVWKDIKTPFISLIVVIVIYLYYVSSAFLLRQKGLDSNQLTEGQKDNWDYLVAVSLAEFNPWLYMAFFIVFWWLMRRMFPMKKRKS